LYKHSLSGVSGYLSNLDIFEKIDKSSDTVDGCLKKLLYMSSLDARVLKVTVVQAQPVKRLAEKGKCKD